MDDSTFDRLTKTLARAGTRRAALAALLAAAGTVSPPVAWTPLAPP